jgi:hypothetical protein
LRGRALLVLVLLSMVPPAAAPQNAEREERPPAEALLWDHVRHLEDMIRLWPKREYYLELAELYGRIGDSRRELELYEIAHEMGWLDQTKQYVVFAQQALQQALDGHFATATGALKVLSAYGSRTRQALWFL